MNLESVTTQVGEKLANAASSLDATVKFVLGADSVVFVDGKANPSTVSNENKDADCTVNIELADFQDMLSGDLNPMSAFMGGKMRIDGDMSVAMKLQSLFS
jgi:putative sterol carrier protein